MNIKNVLFLLSLFLIGCANKPQIQDSTPIHKSLTIESKHVGEPRIINIWTPPNYETGTDSFPVLYMPDGGIKEDFPHIANTIAKLVAAKSIPPIILVGIENTKRGRDLTGLSQTEYDAQYAPATDGAKNFRTFIIDELVTQINKKYRTTNERGILGESLAGLFVVETFLLAPNSFDFYIAMDPSIWWNNHQLVKTAKESLSQFPDKNLTLWFAGSSVEDISVHTKSLAVQLKSHAPENLTWKYSDEPNEKHNTIFRATKEKALIWTLTGSKQ